MYFTPVEHPAYYCRDYLKIKNFLLESYSESLFRIIDPVSDHENNFCTSTNSPKREKNSRTLAQRENVYTVLSAFT
jgi:hypothetical protein